MNLNKRRNGRLAKPRSFLKMTCTKFTVEIGEKGLFFRKIPRETNRPRKDSLLELGPRRVLKEVEKTSRRAESMKSGSIGENRGLAKTGEFLKK